MAYNGWANWETWNAKLWLDNTEETYKAALVYAQRGDKQALRNLVKDYTGACSLDGVELPMVDWDEIIASYMEE